MLTFDELSKAWEEYADRLLLIARSLGDSGEDAVQEAFLALARQPRMPDQPFAWLVKVTRNQVRQWNRSEARRARRHRTRAVHDGPLQTDWLQSDSAIDLDAAEVTQALQTLPNSMAEIITMHVWGNMPFQQIAQVVGSSRSTVHRRYNEALTLLRQRFECRTEG